jgi:hypothetical protein
MTTPGPDPAVDGNIAALRMALAVLDGETAEDAGEITLSRAAALQGLGYMTGRYLAMCQLYACLIVLLDLDEDEIGELEPATPEAAGKIARVTRAMVERSVADLMLRTAEPEVTQ